MKLRIGTSWMMFVLLAVIGVAVYLFAPKVPFNDQWPLYEALRTTSAIIFAVVGAWIAIAFPERLRLLSGNVEAQRGVSQRFRDLFEPIVHSTVTLCVILLVGIAVPIVKGMSLTSSAASNLGQASFALLVFLTLWQVWTIVLTLVPADILKSAMDRDLSASRSRNALRGLGATLKPDQDQEDL